MQLTMASWKRKEPEETALSHKINNADEIIRQELWAHLAKKRAELMAEHVRQLEHFDAKCRKELYGDGFEKSNFVCEARAKHVNQAQLGYCCVCKESLSKKDVKV